MAAKVEAFPEGTRRKLTRPRDQFRVVVICTPLPSAPPSSSISFSLTLLYRSFASRSPPYLIISFPRFLQLQFVLRPGLHAVSLSRLPRFHRKIADIYVGRLRFIREIVLRDPFRLDIVSSINVTQISIP